MIYLQCRAGGVYPIDHTLGQIREFTYFLNAKSGSIELDRDYSWVKCNNEFRGYYVTEYTVEQFAAFDEVLSQFDPVCLCNLVYILLIRQLTLIFALCLSLCLFRSKSKKIFSVADRTNLIHNAFALSYLGTQSYGVVSFLLDYMQFIESSYVPWRAFTWHMTKIAALLEHRPSFIDLKVSNYMSIHSFYWFVAFKYS